MMATPRITIWISILLMSAAGSASAGSATNLAPPGPCAEARRLEIGVAPSDFSVVGSLTSQLDPVDVGAPPPGVAALARPSARPMERPGACEGAGSSCAMTLRAAPSGQATAIPIPTGTVRYSPRHPRMPK